MFSKRKINIYRQGNILIKKVNKKIDGTEIYRNSNNDIIIPNKELSKNSYLDIVFPIENLLSSEILNKMKQYTTKKK